jgi:hypothetical protein
MKEFDDCLKSSGGALRGEQFGVDHPQSIVGIELIECDSEPAPEEEIPDYPGRVMLPKIRKTGVAGVLLLTDPMVLPFVALGALCAWALLPRKRR